MHSLKKRGKRSPILLRLKIFARMSRHVRAEFGARLIVRAIFLSEDSSVKPRVSSKTSQILHGKQKH